MNASIYNKLSKIPPPKNYLKYYLAGYEKRTFKCTFPIFVVFGKTDSFDYS